MSPTILVTRIVVVSDACCSFMCGLFVYTILFTILVIGPKYEVLHLAIVVLFSSWDSVY